MKRILFYVLLALGFSVQSSAQTETTRYETITLTDGSIIDGFLQNQNLIKDKNIKGQTIEVFAHRVERSIPDTLVQSTFNKSTVNFTEIETWWQDWFDAHENLIEKRDGKEFVSFNQITLKPKTKMPWGDVSGNLKVLEMGTWVKYVQFPRRTLVLDAKLIAKITYPAYNSDVLTGVEETVYTKDNKHYTGYLSYLVPGKLLGLYQTDNINQMVNIAFSNIQKRTKERKNHSQSLNEQVLFLDKVQTIDGRTLTGVITAYDYGSKKENAFITLLHSNVLENIELKNVKMLSRVENGDYRAVEHVHVDGNDILFSGKSLQFRKSHKFNELNLVFDNDSLDVVLDNDSVNGRLDFYFKDTHENKNISLIKLKKQSFKKRMLWSIPTLTSSELVKGFGSVDAYVFGFENIVRNNINSVDEDYPDGIKKRTFYVTPGIYIMYRPFFDDIVLIKLK